MRTSVHLNRAKMEQPAQTLSEDMTARVQKAFKENSVIKVWFINVVNKRVKNIFCKAGARGGKYE